MAGISALQRRAGAPMRGPAGNRPGLRDPARAAALALAVLMLVMALASAGHGIAHLGHAHDSDACAVCRHMCSWDKLLRLLVVLTLLAMMQPARHLAGCLRLGSLPLLPHLTPVLLKVKQTD